MSLAVGLGRGWPCKLHSFIYLFIFTHLRSVTKRLPRKTRRAMAKTSRKQTVTQFKCCTIHLLSKLVSRKRGGIQCLYQDLAKLIKCVLACDLAVRSLQNHSPTRIVATPPCAGKWQKIRSREKQDLHCITSTISLFTKMDFLFFCPSKSRSA